MSDTDFKLLIKWVLAVDENLVSADTQRTKTLEASQERKVGAMNLFRCCWKSCEQ